MAAKEKNGSLPPFLLFLCRNFVSTTTSQNYRLMSELRNFHRLKLRFCNPLLANYKILM